MRFNRSARLRRRRLLWAWETFLRTEREIRPIISRKPLRGSERGGATRQVRLELSLIGHLLLGRGVGVDSSEDELLLEDESE